MLETQFKWLLLGERLGEGFRMYSETFDYTGPLAAYTYKFVDVLFGRSWLSHQILATLIVMIQASILNIILLRNGAFKENNYFPAFFYILVASAIPDAYALSPQLMSLTFILLSLNNIFRRIDNEVQDELFLYAGLYLGIAMLFYLPAVVYFVVMLSSLLLFSSPAARRLMLFFYGLVVPVIISFCYFYWYGAQWAFIDSYLLRGILNARSYNVGIVPLLIAGSFFLFLSLLTILSVLSKGKYANFQTKIQQVMLLTIGGGMLAMLVSVELGSSQLILFVPALSFFLSHYVLLLRKPLYQLTVPYLLVIGLLVYPYLPFHQTNLELPQPAEQKQEKLLYFGSGLGPYQTYQIGSPFLDQKLSNRWLGKLDYYQPAARIHDNLLASDPDVIIDDLGVVSKLFFRFPQLEARYERRGSSYYRVR
ncbi:MAG: hypothetical protein R8G66_29720 [Cytophagales bacterium]|nr:hypothetical protein [Cytophagales bacterium]